MLHGDLYVADVSGKKTSTSTSNLHRATVPHFQVIEMPTVKMHVLNFTRTAFGHMRAPDWNPYNLDLS